jgi:hypothetical protein
VGTSRLKTEAGLAVAADGAGVVTVCACADVNLSDEPEAQRFVHDVQAASGAPPGAFAVEAHDAGRLLIDLLEGSDGSRSELVAELGTVSRFRGLGGAYAFAPDGSLEPPPTAGGRWRAAGSRWLPDPPPDVTVASPA